MDWFEKVSSVGFFYSLVLLLLAKYCYLPNQWLAPIAIIWQIFLVLFAATLFMLFIKMLMCFF